MEIVFDYSLGMGKGGFIRGTAYCTKQKKLMLRLQGIRSPNSLDILCWTYSKTDNSLTLKQSVLEYSTKYPEKRTSNTFP